MTSAAIITLGAAAAFGSITLVFLTAQGYVLERRQVFRSLRTVRGIELRTPEELKHKELAAPLGHRLLRPGLGALGRIGRRLTPIGVVERLEQELVHAGSPAGWDAERVLAFKVLLTVGLGVGALVLGPLVGVAALKAIVLAAVLALLGWYAPEWIVRSRAGERQSAIQRSLPDSLDLLSISVEAGLGFDAALDRVAREVKGPLGQELFRVVQEMQLGTSRVEALRALSDRNNVPELKSFVLAMVQADLLGVSIGSVLQVQAREMRIKRRQRAEERAQKLPVKIVFPLIFCIFPSLFVVLLGPAAIRISQTVLKVF